LKKILTDPALKALKPAVSGKRYDVADGLVPGLVVRVTDKGTKTFCLVARYPGSRNPTRRSLGEYGALTLEAARDKARDWHGLLQRGIDPDAEAKKQKRLEEQRQGNSFARVAEAYFEYIRRQGYRRAAETERDIRVELVSRWGTRPIADVSRADLRDVIDAALKRGAPWRAHHIFSYASRMWNWAIENDYCEQTPCAGMRPKRLIGEKRPRVRVLSDRELRALWVVSGQLGYPYGSCVRLIMLTGQRRSEVAEARWSEIDLDAGEWLIPAERMKSGAAHLVPLSGAALELITGLPRFESGDHLFSYKHGRTPLGGFSTSKARLDTLMAQELGAAPPEWVLHDIRRTVRTRMSALPIAPMVAELVIAHGKQGMHKVYDLHSYAAEKRHALELWVARLRSAIAPPPDNVVAFGQGSARIR
jgi:integrase